ncbi:MAG: alpha/beta fold hydrolase [Solirubrobacteraceae bacterium]
MPEQHPPEGCRRCVPVAPPAPALFVWGGHDTLIPAGFGRHVRKWLPSAEQVTIQACGHVPQAERADECNSLLSGFFARAEHARRVESVLRAGRSLAA